MFLGINHYKGYAKDLKNTTFYENDIPKHKYYTYFQNYYIDNALVSNLKKQTNSINLEYLDSEDKIKYKDIWNTTLNTHFTRTDKSMNSTRYSQFPDLTNHSLTPDNYRHSFTPDLARKSYLTDVGRNSFTPDLARKSYISDVGRQSFTPDIGRNSKISLGKDSINSQFIDKICIDKSKENKIIEHENSKLKYKYSLKTDSVAHPNLQKKSTNQSFLKEQIPLGSIKEAMKYDRTKDYIKQNLLKSVLRNKLFKKIENDDNTEYLNEPNRRSNHKRFNRLGQKSVRYNLLAKKSYVYNAESNNDIDSVEEENDAKDLQIPSPVNKIKRRASDIYDHAIRLGIDFSQDTNIEQTAVSIYKELSIRVEKKLITRKDRFDMPKYERYVKKWQLLVKTYNAVQKAKGIFLSFLKKRKLATFMSIREKISKYHKVPLYMINDGKNIKYLNERKIEMVKGGLKGNDLTIDFYK